MLPSLVRTLVPLIVGFLLSLAVRAGLDVDEAALTSLVTSLVTGGYYVVARLLEKYVAPQFGWLLGLPVQPTYDGAHKAP